jgi:hypothetical protein
MKDTVKLWSNVMKDTVKLRSNSMKDTVKLWSNVMKDTVKLWSNAIGRTCGLKKRLRDLKERTRGLGVVELGDSCWVFERGGLGVHMNELHIIHLLILVRR